MTHERLRPRNREVHPPAAEREPDPRDREDRRVDAPAGLAVDERVERGDGAEDDLSQRDDDQQPVALGDVMRVPRRRHLALCDERRGHLDHDEQPEQRQAERDGRLQDHEQDPAELQRPDHHDVRPRRRGAVGIVPDDLRPQEQQREPHDDVARDHHAVVERLAAVERREHLRQPEREDDHPRHLHHRRDAEHRVVGVVGGREPRVVQPRPAHCEGREHEPADRHGGVPLSEVVGEARRRPCRRPRRWSGRTAAPAASRHGGARTDHGR